MRFSSERKKILSRLTVYSFNVRTVKKNGRFDPEQHEIESDSDNNITGVAPTTICTAVLIMHCFCEVMLIKMRLKVTRDELSSRWSFVTFYL